MAALLTMATACGDSGAGADDAIADLEARLLELERSNADLQTQLAEAQADLEATTTTTMATTTTVPLYTIEGEFDLVGSRNFTVTGDDCEGTRGYDDFHDRFQLQLKDEAGRVLSFTSLGQGTRYGSGELGTDYGQPFCQWTFRFERVDLSGLSTVTVASRRGDVLYSADEARRFGVGLVIGDD